MSEQQPEKDPKRFSMRVPLTLYRRFQREAERRGLDMTTTINTLADERLRQIEAGQGQPDK